VVVTERMCLVETKGLVLIVTKVMLVVLMYPHGVLKSSEWRRHEMIDVKVLVCTLH
jgi:hypothetical protein